MVLPIAVFIIAIIMFIGFIVSAGVDDYPQTKLERQARAASFAVLDTDPTVLANGMIWYNRQVDRIRIAVWNGGFEYDIRDFTSVRAVEDEFWRAVSAEFQHIKKERRK